MKLTLKNFRCYNSKTFEFDDETTTLISGQSGCGKTTILLAIQFALYGTTSHKYLVSFNKTSCEVILEYKNFMIKRTKRPNILNVKHNGVFYEDKEAQIILNKYFGITNSSIFFLDLSTNDKMEFLERIVNDNYDVKNLKLKIKNAITDLSRELDVVTGQISNTQNMLDIIQKPEKVEKPGEIGAYNFSKEELILKKAQTIKNIELENIKIQKYNDVLNQIKNQKEELDLLGYINHDSENQIKELEKNINDYQDKINHFLSVKDKTAMINKFTAELEGFKSIDELEEEIEKLGEEIKLGDTMLDLHIKQKQYRRDLYMEKNDWEKRKLCLESQIEKIKNYGYELTLERLTFLRELRLKLKDATVANIDYKIETAKGEIEALKAKFFKSFKCLKCNHTITINMDTMEVSDNIVEKFDNDNKTDIETIKKLLARNEKSLDKLTRNDKFIKENASVEDIESEIEEIKGYFDLVKKNKPFEISKTLLRMEKDIEKIKSELPQNIDTSVDIELDELKDRKRDLHAEKRVVQAKLKTKNELLEEIKDKPSYDHKIYLDCVEKLKGCNESLKTKLIEFNNFKVSERILGKIKSLNLDLKKIKFQGDDLPKLKKELEDIELGLEYQQKLQEYKSFQMELIKYKKVKSNLQNLLDSKNVLELKYHKTLLFKKKVTIAEQITLQFMINIINSHLSILLDDFFKEDPIQIYLELSNETRPQVNVIINYKGNKVDYKSLSTGEYARVKLAFDLTFKEILGEKIIMLDECTANLEQDLSTKIFKKIKDTFPSKTILIIAHQVITGHFDNILKL
jgi:DNA repair exonuclease SbcCD ATPase subunit